MTLSVERRVGALVEIRVHDEKVTVAEAERFIIAARATITDLAVRARRRAVICTDLRSAGVFPQEVSDLIIGLMKRVNVHIERSAVFGADGTAVFTLQVQRMLSEAGNAARRRMFSNPEKLRPWLSEVLEPDAQMRLAEFLNEPRRAIAQRLR